MRIAQVTSSLADPLGGAEQYCIELTKWLAAEGHDVTLLGAGAGPDLRRALADHGVTVIDARIRRPYRPGVTSSRVHAKLLFHGLDLIDSIRPTSASRWLRSGGFEVVHVHRWTGFGASVLREDHVGAPTVHTVHDFALVDTATTTMRGGAYLDALPLGQRLRGQVLRMATAHLGLAVFPTERTRARHDRLGAGIAPERSVVLPHGWRLPRPAQIESSEAEDDTTTFLYMGKLIEEKGVLQLLEAWGGGVDGARLRIAGAGALEDVVQRHAGLNGVEFLGWLGKDEQATALAAADVLVLPSLWPENFPLVVAEALVAGVPVLATTQNAPDVLQPDVNSRIVPSGAQSLRAAMTVLSEQPQVVERLAGGARASAAQLDFDLHGRRVLDLYPRR